MLCHPAFALTARTFPPRLDQGASDIFLEEKCFQAVCDRTLCQKSEVKLCIRVGEGNRIAVDPDIVVIDVREQGIDLGLLWDRTCRVSGKVPELGNRRDCRIDQTVCFFRPV